MTYSSMVGSSVRDLGTISLRSYTDDRSFKRLRGRPATQTADLGSGAPSSTGLSYLMLVGATSSEDWCVWPRRLLALEQASIHVNAL